MLIRLKHICDLQAPIFVFSFKVIKFHCGQCFIDSPRITCRHLYLAEKLTPQTHMDAHSYTLITYCRCTMAVVTDMNRKRRPHICKRRYHIFHAIKICVFKFQIKLFQNTCSSLCVSRPPSRNRRTGACILVAPEAGGCVFHIRRVSHIQIPAR